MTRTGAGGPRRRGAGPPSPRRTLPSLRTLRTCAAVGAAVAAGVTLTACSGGAALGLATQTCAYVQKSLVLYRESLTQPGTPQAAEEQAQATAQLQDAAPLAAEAAGESPQWQALMATVGESTRLPEADLVQALEAQCAVVSSHGTTLPTLPVTTLPVTTSPTTRAPAP